MVLLAHQRLIVELLVRRIAPKLLAHALMRVLGQRFGESVGQRLQQDGAVVIVGGLERACAAVLATGARGDGEGSEPVSAAFIVRGDVSTRWKSGRSAASSACWRRPRFTATPLGEVLVSDERRPATLSGFKPVIEQDDPVAHADDDLGGEA